MTGAKTKTALANGTNRSKRDRRRGRSGIEVEWRSGTLDDAMICAAAANGLHGRQRSKGDIGRSLEVFFATSLGKKWLSEMEDGGANKIADHVKCSRAYVYRLAPASTVDAKPNSQSSREDGDSEPDTTATEPDKARGPSKDQAKRDAIAAHYKKHPDATIAEVAKACSCSTSTVARWRKESGVAKERGAHTSDADGESAADDPAAPVNAPAAPTPASVPPSAGQPSSAKEIVAAFCDLVVLGGAELSDDRFLDGLFGALRRRKLVDRAYDRLNTIKQLSGAA